MKCVQCESEVQDGSEFCSQCGARQVRGGISEGETSQGRRPSIRGRVLAYNWKTNTGVISGEDSFRYQFDSNDWNSEQTPRIGAIVDFVASGDHAIEIYLATTANSTESKRLVAGLLGILLGVLGIHKFYLGYNLPGIIMLIAGTLGWILVVPGFVILVIGIVEGVIYITKSDEEFNAIHAEHKRPWF